MAENIPVVPEGETITKSAEAGKYLTFSLHSEEYGVEILKVKEIIGLMVITTVPRTPNFIRGVINLRGKVIPVMELRKKFGMESIDDTERTCIIVVDISIQGTSVQIGILVDSVSEVINIESGDIADTPSFGTDINTEFILGMGKIRDKVIMLLDIDRVMTTDEISLIRETV